MDAPFRSSYKNLHAYQKAFELALLVYRITKKFPHDEMFGLISQMRRSVSSVAANIAEGCGRKTMKDRLHFFYIARGSLNEFECHADLSFAMEYLTQADMITIRTAREDSGKTLAGLIRSSSV